MYIHKHRALARTLAVAALSIGLLASTVAPAGAAAATGTTAEYVALGDSYAAGQGAPPYSDAACLTNPADSYPALVAATKGITRVEVVACSGATVKTVRETQLDSLSKATKLVTVTVGANDVQPTAILAACSMDAASWGCRAALAKYAVALRELGSSVPQLAKDIRRAAPGAKIVATGYPMLFESGLSPAFDQANTLTAGLNAVLAAAWLSKGARFVDVNSAFAGHRIGSADPWINYNLFNPAANFLEPASFHPNAAGYQAYAGRVLSVQPRGWFTFLNLRPAA